MKRPGFNPLSGWGFPSVSTGPYSVSAQQRAARTYAQQLRQLDTGRSTSFILALRGVFIAACIAAAISIISYLVQWWQLGSPTTLTVDSLLSLAPLMLYSPLVVTGGWALFLAPAWLRHFRATGELGDPRARWETNSLVWTPVVNLIGWPLLVEETRTMLTGLGHSRWRKPVRVMALSWWTFCLTAGIAVWMRQSESAQSRLDASLVELVMAISLIIMVKYIAIMHTSNTSDPALHPANFAKESV